MLINIGEEQLNIDISDKKADLWEALKLIESQGSLEKDNERIYKEKFDSLNNSYNQLKSDLVLAKEVETQLRKKVETEQVKRQQKIDNTRKELYDVIEDKKQEYEKDKTYLKQEHEKNVNNLKQKLLEAQSKTGQPDKLQQKITVLETYSSNLERNLSNAIEFLNNIQSLAGLGVGNVSNTTQYEGYIKGLKLPKEEK
jgi:phenylalanyl-tRNA synthetase alpha subunit